MPVLAVASGRRGGDPGRAAADRSGSSRTSCSSPPRSSAGPLDRRSLAVVAAALTFAYIGRFWLGLFLGPRARTEPRADPAAARRAGRRAGRRRAARRPRRRRRSPSWPPPPAPVTHGAAVTSPRPTTSTPAPRTSWPWRRGRSARLLLAAPRAGAAGRGALAAAGDRVGPRRLYGAGLHGAQRGSRTALHDREVRDLRTSIAAVLVPAGVLVALGVRRHPDARAPTVGRGRGRGLADRRAARAGASSRRCGRARPRAGCGRCSRCRCVGFALAAVYALVGAPDVALVAVVVETDVTLVFLAVFARLPAEPDRDRRRGSRASASRRRDVAGRGGRGR